MSATFLVDLKNVAKAGASVAPQTIATATTTNGSAVDLQLADGVVTLAVVTGNCGDSSLTLDAKLQESADGSTSWADISGASMTQLTGATGADNLVVFVGTNLRSKRYVRAVVTTAGGGTLSVPIAAFVLSRKKIVGTGTGTQT